MGLLVVLVDQSDIKRQNLIKSYSNEVSREIFTFFDKLWNAFSSCPLCIRNVYTCYMCYVFAISKLYP